MDYRNMNSEIVWIFGTSGAGKEKIINNITSDPKRWEFLTERLNLRKNVRQSEESLKVRDQRNSDKIKTEVIGLITQPDTSVLIKVQWDEIENRCVPMELKQEIPQCEHRIVMLYVNPDEIVKRLKNETNPNRRVDNKEQAEDLTKKMIGYVVALQKHDFKTLWINSNDQEYKLLSQKQMEILILENSP